MKTRVISALVAAVLLIGALIVSVFVPEMLHLIVAVISGIAAYEIVSATGVGKVKLITVICMVTAFVLPFTLLLPQMIVPTVYVFVLILFAIQLKTHQTVEMPNLLAAAAVTLAVPTSLMNLVHVRDMGGRAHGMFFIIMLLLSAWSSDIGAYLVGVRWGKHKLCPQISPKKTIEGFFGGWIGCIVILELTAVGYAYVVAPGTRISWAAVGITAALCSIISVLGDLSFSLLKRYYGIKDYGKIMPGHGGMLDRFDSVIFVAPIFALLTQYLPIIHA